MNIRWHTINQSTRKLVRLKKDSTAASAEAVGNDRASASSLVDRKRSIEPPTDRRVEPLEPPKHQTSIQTIAKKAGRRQRREVASQPEDLIGPVEEPVEELVQGRIIRSRKARNLKNT